MKIVFSLLIAAWMASGCAVEGASEGNVTHADSPGATNRDAGPALCRDGTTPPCNTRD
jgi:hypothetical protein